MKHALLFVIALLLVPIHEAEAFGPTGRSVPISVTTTPSGATQIYVTALDVRANMAGDFSLYGSTTSVPVTQGPWR